MRSPIFVEPVAHARQAGTCRLHVLALARLSLLGQMSIELMEPAIAHAVLFHPWS